MFKVYSKRCVQHLPDRVKLIYTPRAKKTKVENTMLVDVLQLTHKYDAPNVVILANNNHMARAVETLKMEGCKVYVIVPDEVKVDKWLALTARPNLIAWDKRLEAFEDSNSGS